MKDCLLFFTKFPEPGAVKTRLAEDSSPELAAEFYKTFVEEKLAELAEACRTEIIVCFAPEQARLQMKDWLGTRQRHLAQKGSDLGHKMENAFREAFFMGYERVLLAGSDIPGLSPRIVEEGIEALTPETACLGPADDGGYYCIGFHKSRFLPEVFHSMHWSTEDVAQQTLSRMETQGLAVHTMETLEDIDTIEDLETLTALGTSGPLGEKALAMARKLTGL
ncbi:TIGR04282 family arsenosugar biosynthesis glycosyltransferase [Pseudodesulfovibrio piezophilus]|uniref:Glycosyltransferase n=1 Tax=Pseudodesulfovibrio piezophilus (strain DSM 21447 / JCM 15486 / C1TLV30) TaxID=1322246 RepID=M1WVA0_PSEP2|nr:TIGR04282 family arsenosugar biosynthesis glycosyltransferase [Pseudodesulfovibrio piezophilus]CCH48273.1 conserved protein of unknown function [Pseudodesulfovibrio piezophilus C1TLV30]